MCLLQVVGGEQTVDDGNLTLGVEACDAVGDSLADVVEVRRLAFDDTPEDDDGIVAAVQTHLVGAVDELERTRYGLHVDVLGQGAMLFERRDTSFKECSGDLGILLSYDDAEAHVASIGDFREVVFGKVAQCSHRNWG